MADIFISYARSTAAQAQQIAEALRALGYGVWRDDELPAHRAYGDVIEERLRAAKAVVVIWSAEGVRSEWVRSEADRARNDRKLVQLTLDGIALPMPFDQIQCADLNGWSGDLTAPGWRKVVSSIADLIGDGSSALRPIVQSERAGLSVCVLPFANMSNDSEQEYFSDGISEDIITDLSKVSALAVVARNTAFTFKAKSVDIKHVARQLSVSHVLEGSVRKSGNRVRITAQLIDGSSGNHLWAERYDRSLDDIFALQDEISQAIVMALKLKLFPEERKAIEDRGTTNVEAYDKYLRARALFNQGGTAELTRAAQIYREVLALDPDFALAWYGLYAALAMNLNWVPEKFAAARKEMGEAGAHIEALAPDAWWTHAMRAEQLRLQHKWAEAEVASQKALAAAPASEVDPIRTCGFVLADIGRVKEGIELARRALQLDPLSLGLSARLQFRLDFAGRHEEAQAEYERSKDLAGDRVFWEFFALLRLWRNKAAGPAAVKAQFQVFLKHEKSIPMALHRVMVDLLDNKAAARAAIRHAYEDPANQDAVRMFFITHYADHFGDRDLALAAVRRGAIELNISVVSVFLWWPFETGLRADPRFKQIVRDLGLYDYWRKSGNWGDFARPVGDDDFEVFR